MEEQPNTGLDSKRLAVVTGANKGIGHEICRQLLLNGLKVILTARDEIRGLDAVSGLKKSGFSDVGFHHLDVTNSVSIAVLADFIKTRYGKLDILVNNAGIGSGVVLDADGLKDLIVRTGKLEGEEAHSMGIIQESYSLSEECLNTNYSGSKAVTEALIPLLQLSKSPRIVNVSSRMGLLQSITHERARKQLADVDHLTEERIGVVLEWFLKDYKEDKLKDHGWPLPLTGYTVSKAALNAYTRLLAKRHGSFCINAVCPGFVKTDINSNIGFLTVEEGARGPVKLALLPDGGPSGQFFTETELASF
ncbi:hypothetical protein H6P81_016975 [Aristolochia fimbriata]|uniref:Short-chain dehydrogenase/reductase n=1 Tax=Aristolochia fimbriata TaxID=158543 RepID=A0AAV7DZZ1_ARIFI|nr:hypothetical protein H6P81_016975 [Aristolochia fimbriata]